VNFMSSPDRGASTDAVSCRPNDLLFAGEPWAEEGIALLEKAAGQGHACAMDALHDIFLNRHEYVQAVGWMTKAAEAGLPAAKAALPDALFNLVGHCRLTVSKPVLKEPGVSS